MDDQYGNPVSGVSVTFLAPASGGVFSNSTNLITGTTNTSGQLSESFTATTKAGSYTVSAVVNGVNTPASFSLTNAAGAATSITASSGTPQTAAGNTTFGLPLTATVTDQYGNPVGTVPVTFTAPASSGTSGLFSNSSTTISGTTNASGKLSETFTANAIIGNYTVSAAATGVATPTSFSLTNIVTGPAPTVSATSGALQSTTVNTAFTSLVATVRDSSNNPVTGVVVTFVAPSSGASGVFTGGVTTISGTTNASGQVTESFTANTTAGSYVVQATVAGAIGPASFSLTNATGAAASITATLGSSQSVTVNTAFSALVATVDDQFGNPVAGASVTFTAPSSGAAGLFSNSSNTIIGTTNASGQVSETYTANTHSGAYSVTASVNGTSPTTSFLLTNAAGAAVSIAAASGTPQSATVNTAEGSALTVTVLDQYNNPVPGASVTFTAPSSGASGLFSNSTTIISGMTNASGQLAESFTANTHAGSYGVTAATSGPSTPTTFSLTNTASTATSITAASGSSQSVTVNTGFSALVATVDDVYGNPVPNVSVTFTAPSSGATGLFSNSSTTISGTTNASGQVSEAFTANTHAGSYSITASTNGVSPNASFSLTNAVGAPESITATSGSGQSVTVTSALTSSLTATVDDQYGNPISGVSVTFTAPSSGAGGLFSNSTNLISGTTNASGQVSETFTTNTHSGSYSITASTNGVLPNASFSLTNTASTAVSIAATSGSPQSVTVNTAFSALVATVDDVYGNPVPGASVTFTAPSSGATGLFSNSSTTIVGTTNASGQVSEAFTANTHSGSYSITASTSGVSPNASFSLTNAASTAASITATAGASQSVTVNTAFSVLTATVDDAYGNPVVGASVSFTAPAGGAGGLFSNSTTAISGTTNASGQLSESFTANTHAGSYSVIASTTGRGTRRRSV